MSINKRGKRLCRLSKTRGTVHGFTLMAFQEGGGDSKGGGGAEAGRSEHEGRIEEVIYPSGGPNEAESSHGGH